MILLMMGLGVVCCFLFLFVWVLFKVAALSDGDLVYFNNVALLDESLDYVVDILISAPKAGVFYVVTPNADHFSRLSAGSDSDFNLAYDNADIRVCDSRIIQKLSIFEAHKIKHVVPGSDLTRALLESSAVSMLKILLVGPTLTEAERIRDKYSLPLLHGYTPPMGFINSEVEVLKCIEVVERAEADFVFLALGSPQQEILANRIKSALGDSLSKRMVLLCVGASFDFLSGKSRRAPRFLQIMHLEWLHRAAGNPRRLIPRYWGNFLWMVSYIFKKLSFR